MKASFPYMGTQTFYKKLIELFDLDVVPPPVPTKRTIDLGVKYSPEFVCFPYKVMLGTYIEAIEAGADTIITSGGSGPCRAGIYSEVHEKTLKKLGYDVEFIVFDDLNRDPKVFMQKLEKIKGKQSWLKVIDNFWTAYELSKAVDGLQKEIEIKRAYEIEKGSFNALFNDILLDFDRNAFTRKEIKKIYKRSKSALKAVKCTKMPPKKDRIKIGIVGEIYVVMESSINMNIAEVLNSLGCEVTRSMFISEWLNHAIYPKIFRKKSGQLLVDNSRKYMDIPIGGHECHNIGNIIEYKKEGYDGIIHLMPFACLPELITQSIAPNISKDYEIPIMTLSLDEQTGIANNLTRIEAFVELLKKNKGENQ